MLGQWVRVPEEGTGGHAGGEARSTGLLVGVHKALGDDHMLAARWGLGAAQAREDCDGHPVREPEAGGGVRSHRRICRRDHVHKVEVGGAPVSP